MPCRPWRSWPPLRSRYGEEQIPIRAEPKISESDTSHKVSPYYSFAAPISRKGWVSTHSVEWRTVMTWDGSVALIDRRARADQPR